MKSKYDLLKYLAELGYTKGAEIGVSEGYFSEKMFETIPNLELWCVDNWGQYRENKFGRSQEVNDRKYKIAVDRLSKYNAHIVRKMSMDAVGDLANDLLDFVYIDANHSYDYVMQDLIEWTKKVRPGGMIIGDDYYPMKRGGVVQAVDDYTKYHQIKFNIIDPRPYGIKDRGYNEQPTYWWIK
ncbi:MAG: hypothetical protein A2868_03500 [Candidatus Levybacteria bacterium RIFCSPHIGHO2_01_FULL_40_15b]|nr:MAG: hypothetical protein A2868_03500 [Candidatus Levybacteria bacterium RIFCSPHIGHO2_01_FULL_40_15b]